MRKSIPLFIGLRYLRAKRRNSFISHVSLFAIIIIMLGVMALIAVLSVMNGFEGEIKNRLLSMESHVNVSGFSSGWEEMAEKVKKHPDVVAAAPHFQGFGLVHSGNRSVGVFVRGINPQSEKSISDLYQKMVYGRLEDIDKNPFNIILGYDVAKILLGSCEVDQLVESANWILYVFNYARVNSLNYLFGESTTRNILGFCRTDRAFGSFRMFNDPDNIERKVTLVVPNITMSPVGAIPRFKRFNVVGIFRIDMKEYDSNFVMLSIRDTITLFQPRVEDAAIRVRIKDMNQVDQYVKELIAAYGYLSTTPWYMFHRNLFNAIEMEKTLMFLIMFIVFIVAAISNIAILTMVVMDKESDIAILRTLGASPANIRNIFIIHGTILGTLGAIFGIILGIVISLNLEHLVSWIEQWRGIKILNPDIYYISKIVGEIRWTQVALIGGISFLMSLLATLLPAYKASYTQPAQALRYE